MKNFYFRTNLGKKIGIGNYMRVYRIASLLKKQGHVCTIFVDYFLKNFNFDSNVSIKFLYSGPEKISEIDDANLFIYQTPRKGIVILDDYRLKEKWQTKVKSHHNKLVVIDDFLNSSHATDILINSKPIFLNEKSVNLIKAKNPNTKLLLGPNY